MIWSLRSKSGVVCDSQRPQSPPGDYYVLLLAVISVPAFPSQRPQSPPGDYYRQTPLGLDRCNGSLPKTSIPARGLLPEWDANTQAINNRLPKTSIPARGLLRGRVAGWGSWRRQAPKDLNPRQGITTIVPIIRSQQQVLWPPKDLNPRQGITTDFKRSIAAIYYLLPKTSIPARGLLL